MAMFMDGTRSDTLTRAAFAEYQNRGGCFGGAQQNFHYLAHSRCRKIENGFQALRLVFGDHLLKSFNALAHLAEPMQPREHRRELFALKRLLEKINRAPPHGFDG